MASFHDERSRVGVGLPIEDWPKAGGEEGPTGDFRGSYGYGRPAYRPDPAAEYSFQPDVMRPLPPRRLTAALKKQKRRLVLLLGRRDERRARLDEHESPPEAAQ